MSTAEITKRITHGSPRGQDFLIGFYYLLTVLTGIFVLFFHGRLAFAVDLSVSAFYIAVTALVHGLKGTVLHR